MVMVSRAPRQERTPGVPPWPNLVARSTIAPRCLRRTVLPVEITRASGAPSQHRRSGVTSTGNRHMGQDGSGPSEPLWTLFAQVKIPALRMLCPARMAGRRSLVRPPPRTARVGEAIAPGDGSSSPPADEQSPRQPAGEGDPSRVQPARSSSTRSALPEAPSRALSRTCGAHAAHVRV
jgi:hypothetical protein